MGVPKRLTEKQILFTDILVDNEGKLTAKDCAIQAGYSTETAEVIASKLQNPKQYPLVVNRINELRLEKAKTLPDLTDKQRKFAELIASEEGRLTPEMCAIKAGYSEKSAYSKASQLQNSKLHPDVVTYIGIRRSELRKKYDITFEGHITELGRLRDEFRENKAWTASGNMEVSRGKAAGYYNNQQIHLHKHEGLSQEEIDKKVVEALEHYQPIIDRNAEVVTDELSSSPNVEESSSDPQT
tara:strand:+ start:209 stop:931 length:723 start_codon:yes stop_codon:yes gene_type:complete